MTSYGATPPPSYPNGTQYQKDSNWNIAGGWTYQILGKIEEINKCIVYYKMGETEALRLMDAHLIGLESLLREKIDVDQTDKITTDIEKLWDHFDKYRMGSHMSLDMIRRKIGKKIFTLQHTFYRHLWYQMARHQILMGFRIDIAELTKKEWYGEDQKPKHMIKKIVISGREQVNQNEAQEASSPSVPEANASDPQ